MKFFVTVILLLSALFVCAFENEYVPASASAQVMGTTGAKGDQLKQLLCVVDTAASAAVTIQDGSASPQVIIPANTAVGPHSVEFTNKGLTSTSGAWKVTTDAGVFCHVFGDFD